MRVGMRPKSSSLITRRAWWLPLSSFRRVPAASLSEEPKAEALLVPGVSSAPPEPNRDRVVRITAESLTRLLGLAGEALVQSHRFPPLVDSLWRLKGKQTGLLESLQGLEDHIDQ